MGPDDCPRGVTNAARFETRDHADRDASGACHPCSPASSASTALLEDATNLAHLPEIMRIALAHSHVNTFGGGERAVLELGRALGGRHDVRLLLGKFDPRRTYPELASLPHVGVGPLQWVTRRLDAD